MAIGSNIRTFHNDTWFQGEVPIITSADHGAWLGTTVFDGARLFDGLTPDLDAHCARVNRSAEALMLNPTVSVEDMLAIIKGGLRAYSKDDAVYIRPMYWGIHGSGNGIVPTREETGFAVCLEQVAMAPPEAAATLTRTRFKRPVLDSSVVNAKAGCLYPNNARMLAEANSKGFQNALVADALGNVAETATANVFMVRDGEVFTPIPNGTFLAGITRARHITNLKADGVAIHETILSFDDFNQADEVFMTGNMSKITPVTAFDDIQYQSGPVAQRLREMYWDWAATDAAAT